MRPVRKGQNVLISGWKHCFVQTRALCLRPLKSTEPRANKTKMGVLSAKMTKCADAGLKMSALYKLVQFAKNR